MNKNQYKIILFYKFTNIKNPEAFKLQQRKIAEVFNLKGRMLIAKEGINATFEGTTKDVKGYMKALKQQKAFADIVFKESKGNGKGFTKLMVKVRPEVVTLGVGKLNIKKDTAPMITAEQLDKMYEEAASPNGEASLAPSGRGFVVLDLRNDFEVQAGYFENTVNPKLRNFRDLPGKLKELEYLKDPSASSGQVRKIVAVCTGGIRCEKATVLLKQKGFKNIYQLKDGIHTYIKKFPGKRFKGSLFVFDNRMVTSVVDTKEREVVGKCFYCATKCEEFYNDDSVRPSKKVICCDKCIVLRKNRLRRCIPV